MHQENKDRWARVASRLARQANAEGNDEIAAGYRAEARSWRSGTPLNDSRVPRPNLVTFQTNPEDQ